MAQAVEAYRSVSATEEFRMLERMRQDMLYNEVTALNRARREGQAEGQAELISLLEEGLSLADVKKRLGI
ncbi:MAG: hypothetical protein FWE23_06690 [Chitinivibrionia bacterium]|nr:hypothetical protein [Chitinivibrionia bacterium]